MVDRSFAYPVIAVAGAPRERGRQYGACAGDRIERNVRHYAAAFRRLANLSWPEVRRRAEQVLGTIEDYDPTAVEELRGIAEGADQSLDAIVALNCRTELLFPSPAAECTTVAPLPGRAVGGHALLGQNWDWLDAAADVVVLLRATTEDGLEVASLHEAGALARGGANSAGVGAVGNYLESDRDRRRPGVPLAVIARRVLLQRTLDDALGAIVGTRRTISANYLLAAAGRPAVDLEATPDREFPVAGIAGLLVHANHFHTREVVDTYRDLMPDSLYRETRVQVRLGASGPVGPPEIMAALHDHVGFPDAVCRHLHPDGRDPASRTLASMVIDLTTRELWIADGPPCERPYHRFLIGGPHAEAPGPQPARAAGDAPPGA